MFIIQKLGAFILPAAVTSVLSFGLAAEDAAATDTETETVPMQCQISVTKSGFGHTYAGVLRAVETVSGFYELNLTGRGNSHAMVSQSGPFRVRAGETQTLGQAMFGGLQPEDVDAKLILHVDDRTYVCGTQVEI